jgi:hypothetical protein
MTQLQKQIRTVRWRQQFQLLWSCVSLGLVFGAVAACIAAGWRLGFDQQWSLWWLVAVGATGPAIGAVYSLIKWRPLRRAAESIDRSCHLKDRMVTALQFSTQLDHDQLSPVQRLQLQDAESFAQSIQPEVIAPIHHPRSWWLGIGLSAAAVFLALLSSRTADISAAEQVASPVVQSQADRVEEGLKELDDFQQQQPDPELENLLQNLKEVLEQLRDPGVDAKEALAKLSEMEAALLNMQQQISDPNSQAQLEAIGKALSLSPSMAGTGQLLSQGDLDKAAEALSQQEMPEMDRQTEKAVTEQLQQVANNDKGQNASQKSIQEAANQIAQGLSQGNRSKFSDGMNSLASEARKQSRRKKLSDLLKKQCQCLGECKSECEGECRSQNDKSGSSSKQAGKAAAGIQPGDKTLKLKAGEKMNLKGQETTQGEVETETEAGDPQAEVAQRQYQQSSQQYEALSESALQSEAIPLGHRQTIRKYFELIRPSSAESDAVKRSLQSDQPPAESD